MSILKKMLSSIKSQQTFTTLARRVPYIFESILEKHWEKQCAKKKHTIKYGELVAILRRMGMQSFYEYLLWQQQMGHRRAFIPMDKTNFIKNVNENCPQQINIILHRAAQIIEGKFNLLGSGKIDMRRHCFAKGYQLNWRKDPITSLTYPKIFSHWRWNKKIPLLGKADPKGPWEVGRMQHLALLGQAYWLTNHKQYAKYFAKNIEDFIHNNPVGIGVQWACNMDVSLRLISWLIGISYFQGSDQLTQRWWKKFLFSLAEHGRFIYNHLEYGTYYEKIITSNHHTSNIVALFWLSLCFPNLDAGFVWRGVAKVSLEHAIQEQINNDGSDFESSLPYHRLTVELFLSAYAMGLYHRVPLSKAYRSKLIQALRFTKALRQPTGRQPQVGDADNGRAHILSNYGDDNFTSFDHLLAAGAKIFNCQELIDQIPEDQLIEAIHWDITESTKTHIQKIHTCEIFPDAGLAVMRQQLSYLLFANSPVGTHGFGNHKHNDQLAIEWIVGNDPVIIDGGSYIYTLDPISRNYFRSTKTHNTVMIDHLEQNSLDPNLLFKLFSQGEKSLTKILANNEVIVVLGQHTGYQRLTKPITHLREIMLLLNGTAIITDFFDHNEEHHFRWHYLLHPNVSAKLLNQETIELTTPNHKVKLLSDANLQWYLKDSWYSPYYGKRQKTKALVATLSGSIKKITCVLIPRGTEKINLNDLINLRNSLLKKHQNSTKETETYKTPAANHIQSV